VNGLRRVVALVARTLRALAPGLARPADDWAAAWLADGERAAYLAMDPRDRDHGCRVARRLLALHPQAEAIGVRAALLHDVGKSARPYRVWERVLVHLWTPAADAAERFPAAWQAAWRTHREHARIGAVRLRDAGADPRVVELVARHHDPPGDDRVLAWLAEADQST
jgi:putative nucleotidyltransferase with HDIG domain